MPVSKNLLESPACVATEQCDLTKNTSNRAIKKCLIAPLGPQLTRSVDHQLTKVRLNFAQPVVLLTQQDPEHKCVSRPLGYFPIPRYPSPPLLGPDLVTSVNFDQILQTRQTDLRYPGSTKFFSVSSVDRHLPTTPPLPTCVCVSSTALMPNPTYLYRARSLQRGHQHQEAHQGGRETVVYL